MVDPLERSTAKDSVFIGFLAIITAASASLVIVIQPIVANVLLPHTGANPLLWGAVATLFQLMLFSGYCVAGTLTSSRGSWRVYGLFIVLAVLMGPLTFARFPGDHTQTLSALAATGVIAGALAIPFVAINTTSIATQLLAQTSTGRSPFWLYAASNTGSLLGLVCYPFVELEIDTSAQLSVWIVLATAELILLAGAIAYLVRHRTRVVTDAIVASPTVGQRVRWLGGGCLPVLLFLSCTNYLSVDLGSHPMVWLGPFAAFLITTIAAFTQDGRRVLDIVGRFGLVTGVLLIGLLMRPHSMSVSRAGFFLVLVTIVLARTNHWLAQSIPSSQHLVNFFQWMAAGGVLAGATMTFLVPVALVPQLFGDPSAKISRLVFSGMSPELIAAVGLNLVAPALSMRPHGRTVVVIDAIEGLIVGAVIASALLLAGGVLSSGWSGYLVLILGGLFVVGHRLHSRLSTLSAVAAVIASLATLTGVQATTITSVRTPFGFMRIYEENGYRKFLHGTTEHGRVETRCFVDPTAAVCTDPNGYYDLAGPLGRGVAVLQRGMGVMRFVVVGLGTGTIGNYCRAGDQMTFLEIDPVVVELAKTYFPYVAAASKRCDLSVITGDARISLRNRADLRADIIVVDAFTSDAIPIHLLTEEALRQYRNVVDGGIVAVHISSRNARLGPALNSTARAAGFRVVSVEDVVSDGAPRQATLWMFLTTRPELHADLIRELESDRAVGAGIRIVQEPDSRHVWRDERHSIASLFW